MKRHREIHLPAYVQKIIPTFAYLTKHPSEMVNVPGWVRDRHVEPLLARRPWWPYAASRFVAKLLSPGNVVFEFGGGSSTLWLVDRGCDVTSVEHDAKWFGELQSKVGSSASLRLVEPGASGVARSDTVSGYFDEYVASIYEEPSKSIDLVIVDGRARVACFRAAVGKVKPGGAILLDDSDRPKYKAALTAIDWPRIIFRGLKPGVGMVCETSIWTRPAS